MSREKAAAIAALSAVDYAVYRSKRDQRSYWQRLSQDDWMEFCKKMASWFANEAPSDWYNYVIANKARKAKADAEALARRRR